MSTSGTKIYNAFQAKFPSGATNDAATAAQLWVEAYYNGVIDAQGQTSSYILDDVPAGNSIPISNKINMQSYLEAVFQNVPSDTNLLAEKYWEAQAWFWCGDIDWLQPIDPPDNPVIFYDPVNPADFATIYDVEDKATFISQMKIYLDQGTGDPSNFFDICYNYFIKKIKLSNGDYVI